MGGLANGSKADEPRGRPGRTAKPDMINGHVLDLVEGDPGVDQAWIRRRGRGVAAMTARGLASVALVGAGAAWRIGPFGWLGVIEVRAFGSESPILSGALGLGLLALPVVWVMRRPREGGRPIGCKALRRRGSPSADQVSSASLRRQLGGVLKHLVVRLDGDDRDRQIAKQPLQERPGQACLPHRA